MDITAALAPKSDQLDAIELVAPRTFTIGEGSRLGQREGSDVVEIALVDFPRVWRPSKGMLDAIVAVWGTNAREWTGHRVTLYNDPEVTFGRDKVGGIRISAMTGIEETKTVQIRGRGQGARRVPWRIEPIKDAPRPARPQQPTPDQIESCTDRDQLRAWWQAATDDLKPLIQARGEALKALPTTDAEQAAEQGGEG